MNRTLPPLAFVLICASQLGATDCGTITVDHGFDLWCGDQLCYWKLERGDIAKVPSWHAGDDAVELVGDDVAISQMTLVNWFDTDCIRVDMVANVAETAEVRLEADVFGDGTVDWSERIPTSSWDPVSLRFGITGYYEGVLFRLTKVGPGGATLAQVKAEVVDDADGGCPSYLDPIARPLGATCELHTDCAGSMCEDGVCSACLSDEDCGAGEVCGREDDAPGLLDDAHVCVEIGSREVGELCYVGAECASGACNGLLCGECDGLVACDGGASCTTAGVTIPVNVCAGDPRGAGEPCTTDAMCASGTCDGRPLGSCEGLGLSACYEDDDCPALPDFGIGACIFDAVAGGTCQ